VTAGDAFLDYRRMGGLFSIWPALCDRSHRSLASGLVAVCGAAGPGGPVLFPFFRSELARLTHHAVAKALHIELAHVAFPVCGFGLLLASQLAAYLF
jgi:hypothetical protein